MFTNNDIAQIEQHGLSLQIIENQIKRFIKGFPFINITKAATINNGIMPIDDAKLEHYQNIFENEKKHISFAKFVPASGAATRMFKTLFAQLDKPLDKTDTNFYSPNYFFENLDKFAFIDDLKLILLNNAGALDKMLEDDLHHEILSSFLTENGLGYGYLPKGLLKFHKYDIKSRTAVEEHLVEGALYAETKDNTVHIHFTVSPQFIDDFKSHIEQIREDYETEFEVKYIIDFSVQESYTDTIAVDSNNNPIRDEESKLIFRPAGHGALIENLSKIDDDIIFVKNIDNVVPDRLKKPTITYKKALAGILIETQKKIFSHIHKLSESPDISKINNAIEFISKTFNYKTCTDFENKNISEKADYIISILNRPIRVCGMVKNENEPGGGPFIVKHPDGSESLQIIESAQINTQSEEQVKIAKSATHFNPVDLVCGIKNYKGEKFNLKQFIDEEAGIITEKSIKGNSLKALELPGLWNGAMAYWNTIFVEVPLATFNPVKEINDLLRNEHVQML